MQYIKDIIISPTEPTVSNVAWLKPAPKGAFKLFVYGGNGWTPVASDEVGGLTFEYIQDIPDIIITKE